MVSDFFIDKIERIRSDINSHTENVPDFENDDSQLTVHRLVDFSHVFEDEVKRHL